MIVRDTAPRGGIAAALDGRPSSRPGDRTRGRSRDDQRAPGSVVMNATERPNTVGVLPGPKLKTGAAPQM